MLRKPSAADGCASGMLRRHLSVRTRFAARWRNARFAVIRLNGSTLRFKFNFKPYRNTEKRNL